MTVKVHIDPNDWREEYGSTPKTEPDADIRVHVYHDAKGAIEANFASRGIEVEVS